MQLTEEKFKSVSTGLHSFLKENKEPTLAQLQQALSQTLFSKTYEEAKETILIADNHVNVIVYNGVGYLFKKDRFIKNIDTKLNKKELLKDIKKSRIKASSASYFELPIVFFHDDDHTEFVNILGLIENTDFIVKDGEYEVTKNFVLRFAKKMGAFDDESIFEKLENNKVFKVDYHNSDGLQCYSFITEERISDDWCDRLYQEEENVIALSVENNNIQFDFTFFELLKLKKVEDESFNNSLYQCKLECGDLKTIEFFN